MADTVRVDPEIPFTVSYAVKISTTKARVDILLTLVIASLSTSWGLVGYLLMR